MDICVLGNDWWYSKLRFATIEYFSSSESAKRNNFTFTPRPVLPLCPEEFSLTELQKNSNSRMNSKGEKEIPIHWIVIE